LACRMLIHSSDRIPSPSAAFTAGLEEEGTRTLTRSCLAQ